MSCSEQVVSHKAQVCDFTFKLTRINTTNYRPCAFYHAEQIYKSSKCISMYYCINQNLPSIKVWKNEFKELQWGTFCINDSIDKCRWISTILNQWLCALIVSDLSYNISIVNPMIIMWQQTDNFVTIPEQTWIFAHNRYE